MELLMSFSMLKETDFSNDIKTAHIRIEGVQPLILNNPQMANPLNRFYQKIAPLNAKRDKTPEDRMMQHRIQFEGSLYIDPVIGLYLPAHWFPASIEAASTKIKKGLKKAVKAGLYMNEAKIPLEYDGPTTTEELWEYKVDGQQIFCRYDFYVVDKKRIMKCHPMIPTPWAAEFSISVVSSVLDIALVADCFIQASKFEGLGDNRPKFGRYNLVKFDVD